MKTEQPILTTTALATTSLVGRRFGTAAGATPAAGAKVLGVVNTDYSMGEQAGFGVLGIFVVEAGAAVAADDDVQSDALGRAITKAAGAYCGRALDAAAAAGAFIRVARGI